MLLESHPFPKVTSTVIAIADSMPSKGDDIMANAAEPPDGSPISFRIRFRGKLSPSWFATLQDVTLACQNNGKDVESTLSGDAPDEGAILGILNMLYELGCSLISVETFEASLSEESQLSAGSVGAL